MSIKTPVTVETHGLRTRLVDAGGWLIADLFMKREDAEQIARDLNCLDELAVRLDDSTSLLSVFINHEQNDDGQITLQINENKAALAKAEAQQ